MRKYIVMITSDKGIEMAQELDSWPNSIEIKLDKLPKNSVLKIIHNEVKGDSTKTKGDK